jgi:hypothetical protein
MKFTHFKLLTTNRWWRWQDSLVSTGLSVINLNGVNHVPRSFNYFN